MVKSSDSGFVPQDCWQSQNFSGMSTSLDPVQPGLPACVSPATYPIPENTTMPRIGVPSIPNLKRQQNVVPRLPQSSFERLSQSPFPHFQNLLLAKNPYLKQKISAFSQAYGAAAAPNPTPECLRRFVIFDQSGSETRLIYSSFPTALKATPVDGPDVNHTEYADKTNQNDLKSPEFEEVFDENLLSGKKSGMHEDTDEINALLYSDDDYDDDSDDFDDEDEVTSTGHSPFPIKNHEGLQGRNGELSEKIADSHGQNKRRKFVDGEYTRSSVADIARNSGVQIYDKDLKPNIVVGQNRATDTISNSDNKQLKIDTILHTLKILEGIIPGAKDKDPLLAIDIAIDYLKSLKHKAKTAAVKNYS